MTKSKFYKVFCILNVLLIMYIAIGIYGGGFLMFGDLFAVSDIKFFCGVILYIICFILKLLLPKIFVKLSEKYKDSIISKFIEFIRNNPQEKKIILLLAFCFDLPYIIYWASLYDDTLGFIYVPLSYILFYAGGVFFLYMMLYYEVDLKDGKTEPFF